MSSPGWKLLQTWLESNLINKWLDPRGSGDAEEFFFKYSTAFGMARGGQDILDWVNNKIAEAEVLVKKERGEINESKVRSMFTGGENNGI